MSQDLQRTWALKIPKKDYEKIRPTLRDFGILDANYEPSVEGDHIFVAAIPEAWRSNSKGIPLRAELVQRVLRQRKRRPKDLKDALGMLLPHGVLEDFRTSFDVIGNIVVIQPTDTMKAYRGQIVEALRLIHPNTRVILAKTSTISGEERVASYERWFGEGPTETVHREHGCVYLLDLTKVFFTPRLSTERKRVASLVRPREVVCDLFAGIGPFSILIAKTQKDCKVFSCDINPSAYDYLVKNISLNKVQTRVQALLGNAREIASSRLRRIANRVIVNLPKGAELYLDAASNALKEEGGIIHLYIFRSEGEEKDQRAAQIVIELKRFGFSDVNVLLHKRVREVAPFLFNEVLDIRASN